jgi:hypothetical protein
MHPHAQGQLLAMRAAQAELERLVAALASALPPAGGGRLRASPPQPPRAPPSGSVSTISAAAEHMGATAMAAAAAFGRSGSVRRGVERSSSSISRLGSRVERIGSSIIRSFSKAERSGGSVPSSLHTRQPSGALLDAVLAASASAAPMLVTTQRSGFGFGAPPRAADKRTDGEEQSTMAPDDGVAERPRGRWAQARERDDGLVADAAGQVVPQQLDAHMQVVEHTSGTEHAAAAPSLLTRVFSDGGESLGEGARATALTAALNQLGAHMQGQQHEEQ